MRKSNAISRIVTIVIVVAILALTVLLAISIPVDASEVEHSESVEETETTDPNTGVKTKTKRQTVYFKEVTGGTPAAEPEKKSTFRKEPTQEVTAYDNYEDFDKLMHKERGSQYEFKESHTVSFEISESTTEMRVSIHHASGEDASEEYFVYDEDGREIMADVEYLPNEMVLILRNVHKGQKFTVVAKNKGMDGIYVTQETSGEYLYDGDWVDNSIPGFDAFGYYNYTEEVYRTLRQRDQITEEQLNYLLQTYPLIPTGSLLKREGVAKSFIRIQDEYGISALGLLAIACCESNYGVSHIAVGKQNLFGWGAVDSDPYNGAWDWSTMSTEDAIYKALQLISINYPLGEYHQDCYYTMRWNNGKHQYCTSVTWPNTNAVIRAQLETYLGLR